jgi:hypothetical protein
MTLRHLPVVLALLVAGCSASTAPDAGPAVPVASQTPITTGPIDGFYRGSSELIAGSPDSCPNNSRGAIEIGDRAMLYSYTTDAIFVAPVSPEGQLHAQAGGFVLDGTLNEGQLEFTVEGQSCKTAFMFHRLNEF